MSEDYTMSSFKTDSSNEDGYILHQNNQNSHNDYLNATSMSNYQIQPCENNIPQTPLQKKKKITKRTPQTQISQSKGVYNKQQRKQINKNSYGECEEDQDQHCTYFDQRDNKVSSVATSWVDISQSDLKEKFLHVSLLEYQIRSQKKFYLSSSKIISMDWFIRDSDAVFDMELYSEFVPVERVIFHKKEGVVELCQAVEQHPPDNLDYVIHCLNSTSSQNAHFLAELLRLSRDKKKQMNTNMIQANIAPQNIYNIIDVSELKRIALELIEQLDPQKIFIYNIFVQDPFDISLKKVSQGYSEGFLKMMGVSKNTFSSFVMKHKGFEAFSGKSRLHTIIMILCQELGIQHNLQLENKAEVKTFDDFILNMSPTIKIIPLNEANTSFLTINNFDVDVDQLLKLENIRKKEQPPLFQQDFRYQCQVQNFLEKFYPQTQQNE